MVYSPHCGRTNINITFNKLRCHIYIPRTIINHSRCSIMLFNIFYLIFNILNICSNN
nr:MAG TPA: hypothetical protein [Crassvirales sp.]